MAYIFEENNFKGIYIEIVTEIDFRRLIVALFIKTYRDLISGMMKKNFIK